MDSLQDELTRHFAGTYDIQRELTGGGMSRLFLATEPALRRDVVIKILPPEYSSEVSAARFRREAELTARLQHPHILPIIGAGVAGDLLYYVMPFVKGESLRDRLQRDGALPRTTALRLLTEIADALAYAHGEGVIHRDIKPENILLQGDHAVLADFGIAAALAEGPARRNSHERLTLTGMSLGTVGYMAPEQAVGERNVDARADVYSLGVVAYEMIAGQPPFAGRTAQELVAAHLTERAPPLDRAVEGVPTPVVLAVERALAKDPDARFQTAGEFRDALQAQISPMTTMTRAVPAALVRAARRQRSMGRRWVVGAAVVLAAAAGAYAVVANRADLPTDTVTIAVVPFLSATDSLALWREGMVDLLARNLDGAGTLRTVAPTVAVRRWRGTPSAATTSRFANELGAQYAIWGQLVPTAGDAVRLTASLVDADGNVAARFEDVRASVPDLADTLAVFMLRELSRRHRLGAVDRPAPSGTQSVLALRDFLRGEQHFRATSFDSAQAAYTRAAAADTAFALPLRRLAHIRGWLNDGEDTSARGFALRAGERNRRLAPRDSLLVVADSLNASLAGTAPSWAVLRRLFGTLETMVARYPDDPEGWFMLGDARYHHGYGRPLAITDSLVLDAFDRAIALDSAFSPAYLHAPELALPLRGPASARQYAEGYLARQPDGRARDALRLVVALLDPDRTGAEGTARQMDSLSWDGLRRAFLTVRWWPDSAQSALRILAAAETRPAGRGTADSPDSLTLRVYRINALAYRGRMFEARSLLGQTPSLLLTEMALLGAIEPDSARRIFGDWLARRERATRYALPWWAERGDTGSIAEYRRVADSTLRAIPATATAAQRATAAYSVTAADAYAALARRDSAGALGLLATLSDTACLGCYTDRWMEARLRRHRGQLATADSLLSQRFYTILTPMKVPILLEQARIAEAQRRLGAARSLYTTVLATWMHGDASLRPLIDSARQGLERVRRNVSSVTARP